MRSKPSLFDLLDREWDAFVSSPQGAAALQRWAKAEPHIAGFVSLPELVRALRGLIDPAWRDQRLLAVLRLARHDPSARQLVLQVVEPALVITAKMYFGRWGRADASSAVIVTALERIATFPTDRRHTNLAGQIVWDVRHVLRDQLERELASEDVFALRRDFVDIEEELVAPPEFTAADRVVRIVAEGVRTRKITQRHADLVLASRIAGVHIDDIAVAWNRPPQTIRRMRQRAERALVGMGVA